ncbi:MULTISPECIES: PA0069 family radical SAM protein [unclassified Chelatococcus]|uniref:PA0069 family radical SAM protein n=1 Tax=unclassified Chelatococcus TaxID=2638111 RepID=UPI0020BECE49|nr:MULTISPECIES: PA0069 family radical SAM protein [unclassified Chelatococcus]MCO5075961.1 PA0069 family radical SAM protein [Chelatococcus sp.]CAH1648778.1 DNA repair photolyase [Hyphomicrobiales bacterium]CAH1668078.1 DNA repair photolyase [Hyphomicrobiales bacterium]
MAQRALIKGLSSTASARVQSPLPEELAARAKRASRKPRVVPREPTPEEVERRDPAFSALPGQHDQAIEGERRRGRGAVTNPAARYEPIQREDVDDGWGTIDELPPFKTEVGIEKARRIITRNNSPDISFDRSINPYRGCEHGCVYCFARPTHAYMGLSPGLDFESKLFAKPEAAVLLKRELAATGYQPQTLAIGTNTDPYQPIERQYGIMRNILEVLAETNHPVGIVTKSALVTRDIDILAPMAAKGLAKVAISVTTLDAKLARSMEPRAATPSKRLETIERLAAAGIPVTVLVAPIIPAINEAEIETILERTHAAGAREAGYVLLRLPLEIKDIVSDWLIANHPGKARHVLSLIRSTRNGKDYDARWGERMVGNGPYAWMIGRRFEIAAARIGFNKQRRRLRTDLFTPPKPATEQLSLF